jgi:Flp pilus assembly protein CpaB
VDNLMPRGLLGTPRRTIIVGVAALVVATILLLVYLSHYRSSVKGGSAPTTVLVAKRFIPRGTTATSLARKDLFQVTELPKDQLKDGAVSDPAVLRGQVAAADVFPGQQLTTADFSVTAVSTGLSNSAQFARTFRAISIALDATHGIIPQAQTGDYVDVYAQLNGVMGLVLQNVLVLQAPNQAATSDTTAPTSGNYLLRIPRSAAARFAYAVQNATILLTLRPQTGAGVTPPSVVTGADLFSR